MEISEGLLNILNDTGEPFAKRIKLADNAFKYSELPLKRREAFLIKWVLRNSNSSNCEHFAFLLKWLETDQFRELNRNDISNDDVQEIIDLIVNALNDLKSSDNINLVLKTVTLLFENRIFQQFFQYNLKTYSELISELISHIENEEEFVEFVKQFSNKNIVIENDFKKTFLDILLPALVKSNLKFQQSGLSFEESSKILQKCIFFKTAPQFDKYFEKYFTENANTESQPFPKMLLKYFNKIYELDTPEAAASFKLLFHAFANSVNNFSLTFKYLILLTESLGFELTEITKYKSQKLSDTLVMSKSLNIFAALLNVLSNVKSDDKFKVGEVTLSDFLKNRLKSIVTITKSNNVAYEIILLILEIDPLIIESLVNEIVVYTLLGDNSDINSYSNVVCKIFELFAKLHRIQNLLSKMIPTLKSTLEGNSLKKESKFHGKNDLKRHKNQTYSCNEIFTPVILSYFTFCITNLASWQVINLFKTFLYHFGEIVQQIENNSELNESQLLYFDILSVLICQLLASVRIAEHTVTTNVVEKFAGGLTELKQLLGKLGTSLLHKEHNHVLMKSFLNICFNWGEINIILAYYSINEEFKLHTQLDNDLKACNITYLHNYLKAEHWCTISERISNFGEVPCKQLMNKLFLQKLKAIILFENQQNDDVVLNVILSLNFEEDWQQLIEDKLVLFDLIDKLNTNSLVHLAENLVKHHKLIPDDFLSSLIESTSLLNTVNYVAVKKINKLLKKYNSSISTKIFQLIEDDLLNETANQEVIENSKLIFDNSENKQIEVNDLNISKYLEVLIKFPLIFLPEKNQRLYLMYLFALHLDISHSDNNSSDLTEKLIIGILEYNKFNVLELFNSTFLCQSLLKNFKSYDKIFYEIFKKSLKNPESIKMLKPIVTYLTANISKPTYLDVAIIFLSIIFKSKRYKIYTDFKDDIMNYKSEILNKVLGLIFKKGTPQSNLIEPYAYALRSYFSDSKSEENSKKLLDMMQSYLNFCLENNDSHSKGSLLLFLTILHNKSKIPKNEFKDELILKIWENYKHMKMSKEDKEEYSQLIVLIFEHVPNEDFIQITADLLNQTVESLKKDNIKEACILLKNWETILECRFNSVKVQAWQNGLENLLQHLLSIVKNAKYDVELFESIVKFQIVLIQTNQMRLSPPLIDMLLLTTSYLATNISHDFCAIFEKTINILDNLLKYRKPLVVDRLPVFLQSYRILLKQLCQKNKEDGTQDLEKIQKLADCAHLLEKLTKHLVTYGKDVSRIAMFVIVDILDQYEQVTLYPSVKMHLHNCIYSLIALCDHHAVSYLMRVLSDASTEIFKVQLDHYNKYYRFTGKV